MSARRVSREPYKVRRDRREVWVAVAVAVAIVLATLVAVWILAPSDDTPVTPATPAVTAPTGTTTATSATPPATADPTSTTVGG